jgi:hypothetical protein
VRHERALADLFADVLRLCAEAGLVRVELIAVDRTKGQANASQRATRECAQITDEILADPTPWIATRMRAMASGAAMSCRPNCRPRRGGVGGCARPSAGSTLSAPNRRGRSRRSARRG